MMNQKGAPAHYPSLLLERIRAGDKPRGNIFEWEAIDEKKAIAIHQLDGFHDLWLLEKRMPPILVGRYPALGHARYHLRLAVDGKPFP
jgi:hypothetical protein